MSDLYFFRLVFLALPTLSFEVFLIGFGLLVLASGSSSVSSLVYHQAATITRATTTRMTNVVFLSKPSVAAGVGEEIAAFLKLTVTSCGGLSGLLLAVTSSAFRVWSPYATSE